MRASWSLVGFALAVACGSNVSSTDGAGGASVDQGCFDACIDKGVSEAECNAACTEDDVKTSSKSSTSTDTTSGSAGGGEVDEIYEKNCYACMEENADDTCTAEYKACEATLACLQLRNCPFTCGEKPGCVEECNEIIPTGVETLTALVQCMSCGVGPCSDACAESLTQAYCE